MRRYQVKKYCSLLFLFILIVSCTKKPEDTPDIELFNGYAENLKVYPGHNRAKLTFRVNNEEIDYFVLSWDNNKNTREINSRDAKSGLIEQLIDGLNEGTHTFNLLAFDKNKNPAVASLSVQTNVYGEKYISSLKTRGIKEKIFLYEKDPVIEWSDPYNGEIALEVYYTNTSGNQDTIRVSSDQVTTTIDGHKKYSTVNYRSIYLPVENAIDTFFSSNVSVIASPYYASLSTKNVIEKSGLVHEVVSQSSSDIYKGVEYSTIQFRVEEGMPIAVFILRANLSEERLTLSPLMPNNDTKIGLQTVKGMAEAADKSERKVLAAVNADFFDWSPVAGTPWGPVIMNGTVIKENAKQSGLTYFAIRKDGKAQIGYSSALSLTDYSELNGLVGGGVHWLVINGVNGSWGGDTREPRTSAGYSKDNEVYLLVVDGRNSSYSVGLEMTDVAKIMKSLGAYQAINLDGGGSSTMVVKNGSLFEIVNRYSDSSPRAVANSLAIIAE